MDDFTTERTTVTPPGAAMPPQLVSTTANGKEPATHSRQADGPLGTEIATDPLTCAIAPSALLSPANGPFVTVSPPAVAEAAGRDLVPPPGGAGDVDGRPGSDEQGPRIGAGPPAATETGVEEPFVLEEALEYLGDWDALIEIADLFTLTSRDNLTEIATGLETGDALVVQRAAHSLKSSSGVFAAESVVGAALRVEALAAEGELARAREAASALTDAVHRLVAAFATLAERRP